MSLAQLLLDLRQVVLGYAENNRYRLQLRDDDQRRRTVGLHDIAGVHQSQPDTPLNRRDNMGKGQIDLRVVNLPFVILNRTLVLQHCLFLVIHLLLGDGISRESRLVAIEVDARLRQCRLIVRQLAFGLRESRLVGPRIDFQQGIALADHLPFLVVHFHDLALHAARDRHRINRRHRSQRLYIYANIALSASAVRNRHRLAGGAAVTPWPSKGPQSTAFGSTAIRQPPELSARESLSTNGFWGREEAQEKSSSAERGFPISGRWSLHSSFPWFGQAFS